MTMRFPITASLLAAALLVVFAMPAHAQRQSLADRVASLEQQAANDRGNTDLLNQVNQLRTEMQQLREMVEQLQNENEQLKQRNRDQYLDLDGRLNRLEGGAVPAAPTPVPAAAAPALAQAIERDFGSQARWAAEFTAMGKALGGGSGWVLLTWSPRERKLVNQWASDHTQTLAGATPLLALDMYEHAYAMDFGSKAGAYVDGFMKNLSWAHGNVVFQSLG